MNTELRKTIESTVEEQFRFVSKMGRSLMEREIESRVKGATKKSARILEEDSGIQVQLEDMDVEGYVKFVLKEKEKMLNRDNQPNDTQMD